VANIQNILSQDLDVIPQGAGTVILRLKGGTLADLKGDTGTSGSGGGTRLKGDTGAKGDTGSSVSSRGDETLIWMAL
jgi:hypothetical protein